MRARCVRLVLLLSLGAMAAGRPLHAQDWPQRPVRIVVPYAAGGITDDVAHVAARRLADAFGQPFVLEHRPGAAGALATEAVVRSAADGYTLLLAGLPQIAIVPAAIKTSFDPLRDLVPVTAIGTNALVLVVHPSLPVTSVAELVAYARSRREEMTYAASGVGSMTHLAMALFLKRAGISMTPVMYRGGGAAVTDVLAGHVTTYFANVSSVLPYAGTDMLRMLAVSSGRRLRQLAGVPTVIESGYPDFKVVNWTGLLAPAGTPKTIVARIAGEMSRAANDPAPAALLGAHGIEPLGSTPEEFAAQIGADIPLWAEAVRIAGIHDK